MTERPSPITTQNATSIPTVCNPPAPISSIDAPPVVESAPEEDFTIKCICDYADDDGNTIYCEKCDSWQHIECYYPGQIDDASRDDFDHSCADCKPRPVDSRGATERQRVQRQNKAASHGIDKKTKRPPAKSHKKKPKPTDLHVNGYRDDPHRNGSPQEHHPTIKKPKGHRSQPSVSSHQKRSPPFNPHNHGHPPSPAHTPPDLPSGFQMHGYSDYFLSLYDNDRDTSCKTNSFEKLDVSNSMSLWLHDPKKLKADTSVENRDDVFDFLTVDIHELKWPTLRVEEKESAVNDVLLRWKYLVTPFHLAQPGRIGELNGVVGFQKDYCENPENHWVDSAHPRPFVFFLPRLPLFIDTRQEGSILRYARRSCRANTNLEIFIANKSEYHFWFVTERPLAANEQITIPWDFRFPSEVKSRYLNALKMGGDDGATFNGPDITEEEYERLSQTLLNVLSDHGGCACDLGMDCSFARFHRNYRGRPHVQPPGAKVKKSRKIKQNHVSPTSTGHATNSRAASEGQDQYDEDDNRSVSGSARSKPQSRDLTPAHGVGETNGIPLEQSDREKRKLAMVEDTFKKMEQQPQPPRKKKRPSDGSSTNTSVQNSTNLTTPKPRQRSVAPRASISHPANTNSNGSKVRQHFDSSKSGRQSGSPYSGASPNGAAQSPQNGSPPPNSVTSRSRQPSSAPKPTYTSSSTQTEDEEDAWYNPPKSKAKRTIVPLAKKLLRHRKAWIEQQALQYAQQVVIPDGREDAGVQASPTTSMDLDSPPQEDQYQAESPTDLKGRTGSVSSSVRSVDTSTDVTMVDAPAITTATPIKPPPPWPNHSTPSVPAPNTSASRAPELRVQMPPAPTFSTPVMFGSGSATPSSAAGSIAQSPFGTNIFPGTLTTSAVNGTVHPSPAKTTKKLSLSDYNKMKKSSTTGANKSTSATSPIITPASLKPSLSIIEEVKAQGVLETSPIVDSPMVEKTVDPLTSINPNSDPALKNNMPLAKPNGTL
jgi:hypothetical protein